MIFIKNNELIVKELHSDVTEVAYDYVWDIFMNNPICEIYFLFQNKLLGIVCLEDLLREEGKRTIGINKKYKFVTINDQMAARRIFMSYTNIRSVPIISEEKRFVGVYSRCDYLYTRNIDWVCRSAYNFLSRKEITIVEPNKKGKLYRESLNLIRTKFIEIGCNVKVITYDMALNKAELFETVVFVDRDEYKWIATLHNNTLKDNVFYIEDVACNYDYYEILNRISNKGIKLIQMSVREGDKTSSYLDNFYKYKRNKNASKGDIGKSFFGELYDEDYVNQVCSVVKGGVLGSYAINGIIRAKDYSSKFYNIKDGERVTKSQPEYYEGRILFYGPCLIQGHFVSDSYTIPSLLQGIINDNGYKYKCVNYGCVSSEIDMLNRICYEDINTNDIIVIFSPNLYIEDLPNVNMLEVCERNAVPYGWFTDELFHCNHKVNKLYAQALFDVIKQEITQTNVECKKVDLVQDFVDVAYFKRYVQMPIENQGQTVGSIVMNCNPFTYGHRFLIEEALNMVDSLYIFVVEEDQSLFSFSERYAMVKDGTKDLRNVKIVPSGMVVLSQKTFPEYFLKIKDSDITRNVEFDINLFAHYIAPRFGITYRFVGEEIDDEVTLQYNNAMKKILPDRGITVKEIARKEINGERIRATRVREMLKNKQFSDLYDLVPETTYRILFL